jgi:hypothetical protein
MRRLRTILSTITLDEIISLITLGKAEPSLYPRIRSLFLQGDPTLLSEDLLAIERRMEREDRIRMLMGKTPDTAGVLRLLISKRNLPLPATPPSSTHPPLTVRSLGISSSASPKTPQHARVALPLVNLEKGVGMVFAWCLQARVLS